MEDVIGDQQISPYLKRNLLARIEIEKPDFLKKLQELKQKSIQQQQIQQPQ